MPRTLNNEVDIQNVAGLDNDIRDSFTRAMLSEDENVTGVAARDYDINEFFIHNDRYLYKALTAITQGDAIVPGTNAQKFTVSEALYELYAQSADSIRDLLSNVEEGANASRNFVAGEEIIWTDGFLYRVLTTVASGTAWAATGANPNIELAANITSQIQTLANGLSTETTNRENADTCIWGNGSVNLAGPTELTTQRISGVTFAVKTNGTIIASNEQAESGITLTISDHVHLTAGTYKLVGGKDANNFLFLGYTDGGGWQAVSQTTSQDAVTFTITSERSDFRLGIYVSAGETPNFEFRPMITRSDYPYCDYDHYVPYAKTNRDLTDDVAPYSTKYNTSDLINLPLTAGEGYSDPSGIKYLRIGEFVLVIINVKFTSAPSNTLTATLPSGYRPLGTYVGWGIGGLSLTNKCMIKISMNGAINITSDDQYATAYCLFVRSNN